MKSEPPLSRRGIGVCGVAIWLPLVGCSFAGPPPALVDLELLDSLDGGPWSVAINGDVVVMGAAPGNVVHVYRFAGKRWSREASLSPQNLPAYYGWFGNSVAVDGNVLVVGQPLSDGLGNGWGSAYIYRFDGGDWVEEKKLVAPLPFSFGNSVSVSQDVVMVGAESISAYMYRFVGGEWVEENRIFRIVVPRTYAGSMTGRYVDTDVDVAIVGSGDLGAAAFVYRYVEGSWVDGTGLPAPTFVPNSGFFEYTRQAVSIHGDVAAIGYPEDESGEGSAFVYRFNGTEWDIEAKLSPHWTLRAEGFGAGVAISGKNVVISSDDSVHMFRYDGETWQEALVAHISDPPWTRTPGPSDGHSVAIDGTRVVVGTSVAVYTLELPP